MSHRLLHGAVGVLGVLLASGLAAAEPPALRYGFEKGREYGYRVKIVGEVSDLTSTYSGVLTYKVVAADDSQFQFSSNSELVDQHHNREGHAVAVVPPVWPGSPIKPMWMQGGPMGMTMGMGPVVENTGFSRTGRLIGSQSEAFLPFALGLQHSLVVEPLPETLEESWSRDEAGVAVLKRMSGSSFFMRFGCFRSATHLSGKETIRYNIAERKDSVVHIRKVYSLQTQPDGEIVRFDMSGEGLFEFDVTRGLIQASKMQYKILVNEKNLTLTIPISLEYTVLSDAEMAEWQRKQGNVADSAGAGGPAALAPGEREQLIAKLQSGNEADVIAAAHRLAQVAPTAEREDVARALMAAGSSGNPLAWGSLVPALEVWRTPEIEKLMIDALNDQRGMLVGDSILTALARFRTPDAAKAVAKAMNSFRLRTAAAAALSTMGPVAEEYVIPMLNHRDRQLRADAYGILGRVGGEKGLQALKEQLAVDRDAKESREIHEAIEAIHRRGGLPPVMPEERKPGVEPAPGPGIPMDARNPADSFGGMGRTVDSHRPATPKAPATPAGNAIPVGPAHPVTEAVLRKWKDATRSFEVEARLVGLQGDKVTLLRADGRSVTLPLAKLCEEDQQFVKERADAENPFQ